MEVEVRKVRSTISTETWNRSTSPRSRLDSSSKGCTGTAQAHAGECLDVRLEVLGHDGQTGIGVLGYGLHRIHSVGQVRDATPTLLNDLLEEVNLVDDLTHPTLRRFVEVVPGGLVHPTGTLVGVPSAECLLLEPPIVDSGCEES